MSNQTQTIKVLKYVERSFEDKPSFLIELDGIEYISNGCIFAENNSKNIKYLIEFYDCEEYLIELFSSDISGFENVTDGSLMFSGCYTLRSFEEDMSNITNARFMFNCCKSLRSFRADLSSVEYTEFMFNKCESLTDFDVPEYHPMTRSMFRTMFRGCKSLPEYNISNNPLRLSEPF